MAQLPADQDTIAEWGVKSDRPTTAQAMYDMGVTDVRQDIAKIGVPTTVLGSWAAYGRFGATLESTRGIFATQYQQLKGVDIRMSAQGYHFLMWDDAALVEKALAELL